MGRSRMAWRPQMGWILVGWSLVGRLRNRSLLGVYPRWLGLELLLRAPRSEGWPRYFQHVLRAGRKPVM